MRQERRRRAQERPRAVPWPLAMQQSSKYSLNLTCVLLGNDDRDTQRISMTAQKERNDDKDGTVTHELQLRHWRCISILGKHAVYLRNEPCAGDSTSQYYLI